MDECIRLLEAHPLLTLIGADSQPALALGARLMNEFAEGIWLVELELVEDPAGVLPTVTHSLAIAENPQRAPAVTLIEYLREKNILLILNHCDRLLNACSQLTATILENCPDVSILATSRAPLNVRGEVCYRSFTTH